MIDRGVFGCQAARLIEENEYFAYANECGETLTILSIPRRSSMPIGHRRRVIISRAGWLFVVLAQSSAGTLPCQAAAVRIENRVVVGTHRLSYQLHGKGAPLVIIDVGVGESFQSWGSVVAEISKMTSVLVYDRAGYGQSEMGPLPRDAKSEATDLKTLLRNAKIQGPYVLVGHSLGALNIQVFAHEYPDDVSGMVLLDPPPRDWMAGGAFPRLRELFLRTVEEMTRAAEGAERSNDQTERGRASFLRTVSSEHREMFGNTAQQVLTIKSFGNLKMIVIAAGKSNPAFGEDARAYQEYWIEESRKLSRLSTAGEFVLAEHSGHQIHQEAPELVLAAIKRLIITPARGTPPASEK
jgi:pimeloyl-ACP methyl ester carboxylesterase